LRLGNARVGISQGILLITVRATTIHGGLIIVLEATFL